MEIQILQLYTTAAGDFIILGNFNFSTAKSAQFPPHPYSAPRVDGGRPRYTAPPTDPTALDPPEGPGGPGGAEHGATTPGQAGTLKVKEYSEGSY